MKTVVYMDVLFALNLLLTFVCLRLTSFLLGRTPTPFRLAFGSFVGAAFSPVLLLPSYGILFTLAVRVLSGAAVVFITFFPVKGKSMLTATLLFFFVGAAFAGMMLLLQTALQTEVFSFRNGIFYSGITSVRLLLYTAAAYAAVRFVFFLLRKKEKTRQCTVHITMDGKTVTAEGIIDTGNSALDPLTGKKVCIVSFDTVSALIPDAVRSFFVDYTKNTDLSASVWNGRLSVVGVQTVTGKSLLPAFFPEKMTVESDGKIRIARNCILAVTKEKTETGVILHRDIQYEEVQ